MFVCDREDGCALESALAFGRELQRERERRGISLDAVADGTKVAPRYLRALESDDVGNLPGGIFNKGFVRSYCRFLGLNEEEWLQRFAGAAPAPTTSTGRNSLKTSGAHACKPRRECAGAGGASPS